MPADTPDQQITMPVDADAADNPVAFNQAIGDIEPRLVREYTTEADRTTRMTVLSANDISSLSAPTVSTARLDAYDGSNHVSLHTRSLFGYKRKSADEIVNNSTTLQDDNELFVPLPAAGTFGFKLHVIYSATTVADIKFAFTIPAGAAFTWTGFGPAVGNTSGSGDINFAGSTTSGSASNFGGTGSANFQPFHAEGEVTMGGTAGNLMLQWAQVNLEATNATVRARSSLKVWRSA